MAKMSLISRCLGTADRALVAGCTHHECLPPSREQFESMPLQMPDEIDPLHSAMVSSM
jgi:hypothetical protein